MWPVLFNGMAVGFAFQLCHRLHQDRLNHRPAYTDPCVTWLPPANTLANTGAIISPILTGDRFVGEPERHPLNAGSGRISIKIDGYRYAFLMEPEDYMQGYYENHLD